MSAANPYFIYIDLFNADGVTRPGPNQIARVQAFDVNGSVVTDEGQSGYDPSTGGWQPVFMQNIAAFSPPRDQPNLKFQVWDTTNTVVYTTPVFSAIASGSTVKIVIGASATLVTCDQFNVSGHVRRTDGTPVTAGTVIATDVTNGSIAQLGAASLAADGAYSISFPASSFWQNGYPHSRPNLQVTAVDTAGQQLAQSPIVVGAPVNAVIDLTVAIAPSPGLNEVFGAITNPLGLPVAGVQVQAFDVVWTTAGIQETALAAAVTSDGSGNYDIFYQPPSAPGTPTPCGPPTDQINLLVRAFVQDNANPPKVTQLVASPIIRDAPSRQEVDLVVNRTAASTTSEYTLLNRALSPCLGSTDAARFATLNLINSRPDYLTFVAETIAVPEPLVLAYVRAWLVAGEINAKVGSPPLVRPMSPEVIYGLVRLGLGTDLVTLITVMPDQFFAALVTAIHDGIISASIEASLRPSTAGAKDSLLDDWRTVLAVMMTRTPQSGETVPFQQPLLSLVFPDTPVSPQVAALVQTPFASQTTVHPVVVPAGIAAGDLLLVLFTNDGSANVTQPGTWTQLWSTASAGTSPIRFSGFAKVATSSDAGTSFNFATSANVAAAAQLYRIASWSGAPTALTDGVAVATPATGNSTALNPPALTPPWGSAADLWLACAAHDQAIAQTGGPPANYGGNTRTTSGSSPTTNSVTLLSAIRVTTAASEDPGNFTIASADDWVSQTVAIRPGIASGAGKRQLVAGANFDNQGSFHAMVNALVSAGSLTAAEGENLIFVFDLYDKVGRFYPIVAAVYPDKAAKGWKTIADLGAVPLNDTTVAGVFQKGWVTYASIAAGINGGVFPGDIPGRTSSEKAGVYGARLFALFGVAGQQNRFSAGLQQAATTDPTLQPISSFLAANPTFALESTNIDLYLAANPTVTLPAAAVSKLKQLQRVYRLTPDFAAVTALIANGFDSALKVAQVDEGAFMAAQEQFVGGLTSARNIHRTAVHYTSEVLFTLVKFHQNLNEVGGAAAISGAVDMAALAQALASTTIDPSEGFVPGLDVPAGQQAPSPRKLPNWATLFGDTNQCSCDCCQTVLDPGAYLVDLLEFVAGPARKALFDRRRDLADIEITCPNTNKVLPYIDLTNEVLASAASPDVFPLLTTPSSGGSPITAAILDAAVAGDAGARAQVTQAILANGFILEASATVTLDTSANHPPYRAWVISDGVWGLAVRGDVPPFTVRTMPPGLLAFQLSSSPSPSANPTPISAATLDAALGGNASAFAAISAAFGAHGYRLGPRATLKKSAADPPAPIPTGARREWLIEDDAWRYPIRDPGSPEGVLFTVFPAPQTSATNDTLAVFPEHDFLGADKNLQSAVFPFNLPLAMGKEETGIFLKAKGTRPSEVLEAFTRDDSTTTFAKGTAALAYLNLVGSEARAILGPTSGPDAIPTPALWGFDTASSVSIPNPVQPTLDLVGTWTDLLVLVPVFLQRSGLTYQQLLDLLDTEFVHVDVTAGPGIHIAGGADALVECDYTQFQIAHLNDPRWAVSTLRRMSFFIRLWRRLGWTMVELDRYLMTLAGGQIPSDLVQVFQVKRLADQLDLPPRAVFAFWSAIDTRRTDRNAKSLFDQVFLVGDPGQPELLALEALAQDPSASVPISTPGVDLKTHVRAVLRLKSVEIDALWNTLTALDLPALSQIYRVATLCHALGISVLELGDLKALTGKDPFATGLTTLAARIVNTFASLLEIARAQSTKIKPTTLTYYLTDASKPGDAAVPNRLQLETFAQRLASSIASINAALPPQPRPDAAALTTLLAKVIPAQKVVQAVDFLGDMTIAGTDKAFLARYFAPFLPTPSDPFFAQLSGLLTPAGDPDLPARYTTVFATLNDFLIDQAKTNDILVMANELFAIDQDTADLLLGQSLTSLTNPGSPALADWKAFLDGGWDDGKATITSASPGTRRAVIVVPQSDQIQFVASVTSGTISPADVALTIDEVKAVAIDDASLAALHPDPALPGASATNLLFAPLSLKSGTVLNVRFQFTSSDPTATLSLLWRIGNADPVPVPGTVTLPFTIVAPAKNPPAGSPPPPPVSPPAYLKLAKAAGLVRGLALTKPELRHIVEHQPPHTSSDALDLAFSFDHLRVLASQPPVAWADLAAVVDLIALNRSVVFKNGTLFELWHDMAAPTADDVENQTGWKAEDVTAIQSVFAIPAPPVTPTPTLRTPAAWAVLQTAMTIVGKLDLRAQQILDLLVRAEPTAATATTLRNALRTQFTPDTWQDVFKPLRDPLRQKQRDALVGYLTTRPVWIGGSPRTFIDANDLFSFFLIDVQMETDTLISRMVLALNAIQLFVDRVFLGLEDDASAAQLTLLKDQWAWMAKFRVWQANRQVFLYPENYIEPELRDDKSELFKSVEDKLMQASVTDDVGVTALTDFLDGMNEASNLEIVGAYAETVNASGITYVLHVVGRTRAQPRTYYYRTFQGKQSYDGSWTPWITVAVDIKADVVAPAVFNGHLYLFWPTITAKQKPVTTSKTIDGDNIGQQPSLYRAEIGLNWTEYIPAQNKWLKPKVSKSKAFDEDNVPTPFTSDSGEVQIPTDNYHLRIDAAGPDYVSIQLVKTDTPRPEQDFRIFGIFLISRPAQPLLHTKLLGTFQIWYTEEDTFGTPSDPTLKVGDNLPIGTTLAHNGAIEVDFNVEGQVSADALQFRDNVPFLQRTAGTFRVFATNFGYLDPAENRPFFYETDAQSLFALNRGPITQAGLSRSKILTASFQTFHHPLVRNLQKILHDFGVPGLMTRLTEALPISDSRYYSNYYYNYYGHLYLGYHIAGDTQAFGTTQRIFESEFEPDEDAVIRPFALPTVEFGYGTPFGGYNWELFFHLPMLIAGRLSQNLQFADALKWYHYVFDPRQGLNTYEQTRAFVSALPVGARFWTFLPFFANRNTTDSLLDTLGLKSTLSDYDRAQLSAEIDDWRHNPFKPDLIARQRMSAYQKFVFMKYLDNLIAWGDTLFRQDSFESINLATQLYVLADELLGKRPQQIESLAEPQRLTFNELQVQHLDAFSNALVDVEYQIVSNRDYLPTTTLEPPTSGIAPIRSLALKTPFFQIPRNQRLDDFWTTVQDRLFKIRNSLNIEGVKRQLALFEPPINPALLVAAAAAGLDLSGVIAQLNTPLPHYRFTVWMQKAIDICNELKSFGAEFLAALEKRDGEDLQLLRQNQEIRLLRLVRQVRQKQVDEAEGNITALELSRVMAEDRHTEYANREKISQDESTQVNKTRSARDLQTTAGGFRALAALLAAVPDGKGGMVGFLPLGNVDFKIGSALYNSANAAAEGINALATFRSGEATLAGLNAGFERRWEDWKLQERLAQEEMNQIDQQLAVARIRRDIAQTELDNQDAQIDMANDVLDFLKGKFTSRDLYNFMVTQLSRTFQQVYKLAYDAAKTAERTFQFELGVEDSYVQFGYQDSLHQGLLAGEKLIYDLRRMEVAYLQQYKREYEVQKPISLAVIDGAALETLRETGSCSFELPEILFDLDFPGQYFRRIKTVRLTIPCVTGPHTSVSAKLTLLGSTFRKDATVSDATKYAYTGIDDPRFVQNPVGIQAIATGTGQNDPGLFELNFRDERYLPFEGAGAISRWRLDLPTGAPQFDYDTITDVVMQLSYTAREGGDVLKAAAEQGIAQKLDDLLAAFSAPGSGAGLVRAFSLSKEFPDVFHRLLTSTSGPTTMTLLPQHFPFVIRNKRMTMTIAGDVGMRVVLASGATLSGAKLSVSSASTSGAEVSLAAQTAPVTVSPVYQGKQSELDGETLLDGWSSQDLTLTQKGLTLDKVEDIVLVFTYTV